MNQEPAVYTIDEFEREARYLETLVWEAIAIAPRTKVLFCGYGPDGAQVARAIGEGAHVTVIEHRIEEINKFAKLGAKVLRGSTSVIPARDGSFDLAISYHYLHEVDPFFHAQVLYELARVAKRVSLIEPAPPGDPLGKRIALLYSQAKRELGQFEYYQPLEYWKKLLQSVKADVSQHVFAFSKVPPREYLLDTIDLLIDTIEIEEAPRSYIEELREIAKRSDTQLLPPPRYVLMGAAAGDLVAPAFTQREPAAAPKAKVAASSPAYEFPPIDPPPVPIAAAPPPPQPAPTPAPVAPAPPRPLGPPGTLTPPFGVPVGFGPQHEEEPAPPFAPGLPFGAPQPVQPHVPPPAEPASPFGAPFAVPGGEATPFGVPPPGVPPSSTWEWEPPEDKPD